MPRRDNFLLEAARGSAYFTYGSVFCSKLGFYLYKFLRRPEIFQQLDSKSDESPLLQGQSIIVTGANAGIGFEASKLLVGLGARVVMLCRDLERGLQAKQEIVASLSLTKDQANARVDVYQCDVSDLVQIARFAEKEAAGALGSSGGAFSALVHNAGCMIHKYLLSPQKIEINSATNIVGPYALTKKLMELGLLGSGSKVVFVTSGGLYTQRLRTKLEEIQAIDSSMKKKFDGLLQYARNKRQQVALAEYWANRYTSSKGISFCTWHPGWADTKALRDSMPEFYMVAKYILRDPVESAIPLVDLLTKPTDTIKSGALYFDGAETFKDFSCVGIPYSPEDVEKLVKNLDTLSQLQ